MIVELLGTGKSNAVSTEDLLKLTGISNKRELRKIIEAERNNGEIILSCREGGYFKPETMEEIKVYVRTQRKQIMAQFKAIRAAELALKTIEGQTSLDCIEG